MLKSVGIEVKPLKKAIISLGESRQSKCKRRHTILFKSLQFPHFSPSTAPPSFVSLFSMKDTRASRDPVPQEESKLPPPLLFFHNLLFMSDRPPPDKWLPYGERQKSRERERGRKKLCIFFLSLALQSSSLKY